MTRPPFFSVVIATYNNRGRTLRRAVDSVRAQTFQDFELIIVDDGSSDAVSLPSTRALVSELPASIRMRLLTQENAGPGVARNHGVREASGEWVVFLDDDDEWCPEKLARLKETIEAEAPDFVYTGMDILDASGQLVSRRLPVAPAEMLAVVHLECPAVPSVMAFRKSYFEGVGGFRGDLMGFEDWALMATVARDHAERRAKVSAVPATLTRYYQLPTSMSAGSGWRKMLRKELHLNRMRGVLDYGLSGTQWVQWVLRRNSETFYTHGVGARDSGSPMFGLALIGVSLWLWPFRRKGYRALVVAALRLIGRPTDASASDTGIERHAL